MKFQVTVMVRYRKTGLSVASSFALCVLLQLGVGGLAAGLESSKRDNLVDQIRRIFQDGNRQLEKKPEYRNLTLLIGLTGAGKSTNAQVITRNLSELEAYKKGAGFLIKDAGNKISHGKKSFKSWTSVPELFIDAETNSALYDFPGFSDTRGVEVEISNGHFMNEVIRHAQNVRLLVVENYSSVQPGEDRERIFKLIRLTLQFVKNLTAFEGAFAFLATKCRVPANVANKEVVAGIAESLEEVKAEIDDNPTSWAGKEAHLEALFNSWLKQGSNGDYVNIAFFRQPTQAGTLDSIPGIPGNRNWIRQVVLNNSDFVCKPCNALDFGHPLSLAAVFKVQEIQNDLLQETKSSLISFKDKLVENVNRINASQITLAYVGKFAGPLDAYHEGGKDLKSAVETIGSFGALFKDDQISNYTATLEANRLYMADLEKLPIDAAAKFKTNVSTSLTIEVTEEAKGVIDAVEKALGRKLRNDLVLDQSLEELIKQLKQAVKPGLANEKVWTYSISVADASEGSSGSDFSRNVEILGDLLEKLEVTTTLDQKTEKLKPIKELISLLKFVDKWDLAEASGMWRNWNSKIKLQIGNLVDFFEEKAGLMSNNEDSTISCPVKSLRHRPGPFEGRQTPESCQKHILDELNSVNSLIESLAEHLKASGNSTAGNRLRRRRNAEEEDIAPEDEVQPCFFPKDELESIVKKLERPLTSIDSSAVTGTCIHSEVSPRSSCESLTSLLKCSLEHLQKAYRKSLTMATPDNIENLNRAMEIMAEYSVYTDKSTAFLLNQETNRQWTQLSSTMRQLKLTYSCVFQDYHDLINQTISSKILNNHPSQAVQWLQRRNAETLRWAVAHAYNHLPEKDTNSENKVKNTPALLNFFRKLPHLEDSVSGAAVLYNQMNSQKHLKNLGLAQLHNFTLDLTSDLRKTCSPGDTQLKLFAVSQLLGHALKAQYPNWTSNFRRGSKPTDWTEFKQYSELLWNDFDTFKLVHDGFNGTSAAAAVAVAQFLNSLGNPNQTLAGLWALMKRLKGTNHVNTYEYMDVMSIFRQTSQMPGINSTQVAEAKNQVPTGLLNFFFPPSGGCRIVNGYYDEYCLRTDGHDGKLIGKAYYCPRTFFMEKAGASQIISLRRRQCCFMYFLSEVADGCTRFQFKSDTSHYSNGTMFRIESGSGKLCYWSDWFRIPALHDSPGHTLHHCPNNHKDTIPLTSEEERNHLFRIKPYGNGAKFTIMSAYHNPSIYGAWNDFWWDGRRKFAGYEQPDYNKEPTEDTHYWKLNC